MPEMELYRRFEPALQACKLAASERPWHRHMRRVYLGLARRSRLRLAARDEAE